MNTKPTIAAVAGRSGGHVLPALTFATRLAHDQSSSIIFFSTTAPLDIALIKQSAGITHHTCLAVDNVPYKNPAKLFWFAGQVLRAFFKSLRILRKYRPERVISTGGYISIPVCMAARMLRIPFDLYEFNAVPGKAITFLARYARTTHICFVKARKKLPTCHSALIDYPVRFELSARYKTPDAARQELGLLPDKKTIFISGGSQGSKIINQLVRQWLELNPHVHPTIQIIHQTGVDAPVDWQTYYDKLEIKALVAPYFEDPALHYAAASLLVCRAGAGSLFEAVFFNKPAVVIPLETGNTSHQKDNALAIAAQHPQLFSVVLEEAINKDNTALFSVLNKQVFSHTAPPIQFSTPILQV